MGSSHNNVKKYPVKTRHIFYKKRVDKRGNRWYTRQVALKKAAKKRKRKAEGPGEQEKPEKKVSKKEKKSLTKRKQRGIIVKLSTEKGRKRDPESEVDMEQSERRLRSDV